MTEDESSTGEFTDIVAALNAGDLAEVFRLIELELDRSTDQGRRYALHLMRARLRFVTDDAGLVFPDLDAALQLASSAEEQAAVLQVRAEVAEALGDTDMARADLERLLDTVSDPTERAAAEQVLGRIERDSGDILLAVDLLEDVHRRLIDLGADQERISEATLDLAMALRLAGRAQESIALLHEVAATAEPALAARVMLQIGTSAAFAGDYDAAIAAYDRALVMLPDGEDRAIARYNRAVALREIGRLEDAREDLRRGLVNNARANERTEFDLLLLLGIVERERDDQQRSLDTLGEAAALMPDGDLHGRARLEIGTTLALTGLVGLAIDEFTAAAHLCADPDDRARAWRGRAAARQELGLNDAALDDYARAAQEATDPDERARGHLTRAMMLSSLDRRADALAAIDDAAEAAHDPAVLRQVLVQRGALRSATGDLDGAITDLELGRQLALQAGDSDLAARVAVDLGAIHAAIGQEDEAITLFLDGASETTDYHVTYTAQMHLGSIYVSRREPLRALAAFDRAAAAAQDDREARARAFLAHAGAAQRFHRYAAAEQDYARVVTLQPSRQALDQATIGQNTLTNHLDGLRQVRQELTALMRAPEEPSFRAGPMLQRGVIAMQLGDLDAAEVDFTRAARLYQTLPDRALAEAHLALLAAHQGRCDDAATHLATAAELDPARAFANELSTEPDWNNCPAVWDDAVGGVAD